MGLLELPRCARRCAMTIAFEVTGIPKGQPRPKAFSRGGHAAVYDPGTAGEWKALVAAAGEAQRPESPLSEPLFVALEFIMPRPKSVPRRLGSGRRPHTSRPDLDNLAKAVLDALTQAGWWCDDDQICGLDASKWIAAEGERPGVCIEVSVVGACEASA